MRAWGIIKTFPEWGMDIYLPAGGNDIWRNGR